MPGRWRVPTRAAIAAAAVLAALPAAARNPPIALDPKEGVWIAAGEVFVHQARDRWSVFPAGATVNKIAVDGLTVWLATDDGVVRFESGSRRAGRLTMDDGLPSQAVSAVAFDESYVWFGTNKGAVRYRKLDRAIRVFTDAEGLPHRAVTDLLAVGRQVWLATRGGLALYDPDTDGLRAFTSADGLASDAVEELYQVGDDLWCRTDVGLSRYRAKTRSFTNFSFKEIGGSEIRAFVLDGDRVWVGTEKGLASFESTSDAFIPFPQQAQLASPAIVGVETFTDYLFIATEKEVVQYHKAKQSFRRFTEADGLTRVAGVRGTLLSSGLYTLLFADGAEALDIGRDLWSSRGLAVTEGGDAAKRSAFRAWTKLNLQRPIDLRTGQASPESFATAEGGLGFGTQLEEGRSLDLSLRLDYGQLTLPGVRDLEYKGEYLGNTSDVVREVRVEDKLAFRGVEEGLERTLLLQGGQVRVAFRGEKPKAAVKADAGLRRGAMVRDFLTGKRREIYSLSKRYVLPGTERVWVDGELLTAGTDYTIIYPAGQLAFLDPEKVDDLSVIEVEYEHDLMAKKALGVLSILDLLPADKEVGAWTRAGEARLISEESGLYLEIDGGAPKYIDRGWVRSVYAEFKQASRTLRVAIHDMGTAANAESLYQYDLPPAREPVGDRDNVVLDIGSSTSYTARAHTDRFYVELVIEEKSDIAKASVNLFILQILDRGTNAGANRPDSARELLTSVRGAWAPFDGLEVGARFVDLAAIERNPDGSRGRHLVAGTLDGRWERAVGEAGRLTAYGEATGTNDQNPGGRSGFAGMGKIRVSHPLLEGTLSERYDSAGYTPLGSDSTIFGRLRDETRLSATAYPARWLPTSLFFTRQASVADDGSFAGLAQHALARLQLNPENGPATSVQVGHSLLDGADSSTSRVKLSAQTDYDLASGALKFLSFKRFVVRGLFGVSQGSTTEGGFLAHKDRVTLSRLEAKLAPTATETAYALFRSRTAATEPGSGGGFGVGVYHWELNAGARSAVVPGLIPQVNHSVIYDDDRTEKPQGVRSSKGSSAAELGVFPGQWLAPLAPVVLSTRYSLSSDEKAEGDLKQELRRIDRLDNRMLWASAGAFDVELYEIVEVAHLGETQHLDGQRLELRNRVIWRPVFSSPFTFRLDFVRERKRNDLTLVRDAPPFGLQESWETGVEWLKRWSPVVTTKTKGTFALGETTGLLMKDQTAGTSAARTFTQRRVGGELELRLFPFKRSSQLFLVQRDRVNRFFGVGEGATSAVAFDVAVGAIWTLGDNIYLDGEVAYRRTNCLAASCTPSRVLDPRILLTAKL